MILLTSFSFSNIITNEYYEYWPSSHRTAEELNTEKDQSAIGKVQRSTVFVI